MTTPNQPLPSTINTLLGIGAFKVDEPGTTNYGQHVNNTSVTGLLTAGSPTMSGVTDISGGINSIIDFILTLPLRALQTFAEFVGIDPSTITSIMAGITGIFGGIQNFAALPFTVFSNFVQLITTIFSGGDIGTSFNTFIDGIPFLGPLLKAFSGIFGILGSPAGLLSGVGTLPGLISEIPILGPLLSDGSTIRLDLIPALTQLTTIVNQILDIIRGLIVTPINSIIGDIAGVFGAIFGKLVNMNPSNGTLPGSSISGSIPGSIVNGILGGSVVDNITNLGTQVATTILGPSGGAITDPITGVVSGIQSIIDSIFGISHSVQQLVATQTAAATSGGSNYSISFGDYGSISSVPLDITYTGSGTSSLYLSSGNIKWNNTLTGARTATALYHNGSNTSTTTDYQMVTSPLSPPNPNVLVAGLLRCNSDASTCVAATGYQASWANYRIQLGYFIGGTYTSLSDVAIGYSTQLKFLAGVGGNPYRFQVWSGATCFLDYTDTAHVTQLGSGFRRVGFRSNAASDGHSGPDTSYIAWVDNPN